MRLAQLCAERQCSNFIAGWTGARQLAGRVFCHFADASANCDYVTPLKSTSIIIIYDVITRWHRAGRNSRRRQRRSKTAGESEGKEKHAQTNCFWCLLAQRVVYAMWASPLFHVLRIRHVARDALKWLWQIIFLVNAFNMVINQAHTHSQLMCVWQAKSFCYWIRQFKWIRRQCHRHGHRHYHRHRNRHRLRHWQSNNCCGFDSGSNRIDSIVITQPHLPHYSVFGPRTRTPNECWFCGLWNSPQRLDSTRLVFSWVST